MKKPKLKCTCKDFGVVERGNVAEGTRYGFRKPDENCPVHFPGNQPGGAAYENRRRYQHDTH